MATDTYRFRLAMLCAAIPAAVITFPAGAQTGQVGPSLHAGTLEVPVNKSQIVNADGKKALSHDWLLVDLLTG